MSARPAAGKKIKCPSCGEAFVPEIDDEDEGATAIQDKANGKSRTSSKSKSAAPPPGKKSRAADDDDEDEEDEDEKPRKKKKKDKKKSGSAFTMILFGVMGGGFLVSLALCGVGAFVWPGFLVSGSTTEKKVAQNKDVKPPADKDMIPKDMPGKDMFEIKPDAKDVVNTDKGKGPGAGGPDLSDYLLPDTFMVIGSNVRAIRDQKQLEPLIKQFNSASAPGDKMPKEIEDFIRGSERAVVSANKPKPGVGKSATVVAVLASPDAVIKFRKSSFLGKEQRKGPGGKYVIYRPSKTDKNDFVAVPSSRIVLFGSMEDGDIVTFLDQVPNKPGAQNQSLLLSRSVESSPMYGAWAFDDEARQAFQGMEKFGKDSPEMQMMGQALQRAKGGTFAVDSVNATTWKVQVSVECQSETDATAVKDGAAVFKTLFAIGSGAGGAKIPPSVTAMINGANFGVQGNNATVSFQVTNQTLSDMVSMGSGTKGPPTKDGFKDKRPPSKDFVPPSKDFVPPFKDKGPPMPPFKDKGPPMPPFKDKAPPFPPFKDKGPPMPTDGFKGPPRDFGPPKDVTPPKGIPFPGKDAPQGIPQPPNGAPQVIPQPAPVPRGNVQLEAPYHWVAPFARRAAPRLDRFNV